MKKFLAIMLVICMTMAFVPAVSFAADTTIDAVRTAYFNSSGSEWKATDGDNVLVSTGATGWSGANTFTDTDGTVTTQSSVSGTNFGSARHALIAFTIPADLDTSNVAKVTLSMKVKNVKQVTGGARLSVYGNSIDGTWSTATNKSVFTSSTLNDLPLLGLTEAITVGNQTGESASDQVITLSSKTLTAYVCEMADAGKTEVTFRLAAPLGGIRIFDANTATPPQLIIEEGKVVSVPVEAVYGNDGSEIVKTVGNVIQGTEFTYADAITKAVDYNGATYIYNAEKSTVKVTADGINKIVLYYDKFDESQIFSGYEVEDEGAWCWFADPRSITYTNDEGTLDFSIIGYIDIHGSIKATQINHLTDEVNEVLIRTNIQPDDHNNPTFLVLPDERIIVFYSRHTDEACFWYRVTEEKGDLTTLGEEKCLNTSNNTTYPSPFLMENDPDHIYLMWRGIGWHPTIAKLSLPDEDGNTAFTYGPYQMVKSTGARPYAKYASNGVDKLYVTYTTGHPDNEQPNWVYFNQINIADMTLEDINGRTMSTIADGPLSVNKTNTAQTHIVDTAPGNMRDWVWQTEIGEDGKPVIAMVRINGGKTSHDYYYVKWNGTSWVATFLSNGGGHFHQTPGLEMCYSGGMAIDPDNTNIIYCSVPVEGAFGNVYEIIKYTMSDDGTAVVDTEQITKNSRLNNVRPFVLPNSEGKDIRLTWMYGNYYDWIVSSNYGGQGYCTAVHAEAPLPEKSVVLDDAVALENYDAIGGAFKASGETANVVETTANGEFTVNAEIYLEGDYKGTLLDLGNVQLGVETMATQYGATQTGDRARVVLTVDGVDYVSSNVYGSSDCWKTYGRGTGGNYGIENYDGYITHTITYDGEKLTLYREGLVDMTIPAAGLSVENITVGGFDGLADDVALYERVLNHNEIRAFADEEKTVAEPDGTGEITITKNYIDIDGTEIKSEEMTLAPGTSLFKAEGTFTAEDGATYALNGDAEYVAVADGAEINMTYYKTSELGENLVGGYETFTNATGTALDWNIVDISTLDASLTGQFIQQKAIDGGNTASTMRTFIPIEGGKKYYVSNKVYNAGGRTASHNNAGMSAVVATGDAVFSTFAGMTIYAHQVYGGTNSWSPETNINFVGGSTARHDYEVDAGLSTMEFIIDAPLDAQNIMFSFGAWGNKALYYGDFVVREIINVETVDVTVDGEAKKTYGEITLGNEGNLPDSVTGYRITSGTDERFVNAGTYPVADGDVIETVGVNVSPVVGAQVRYGGGLDQDGKVGRGNGLRFIAQVDRSNAGEEILGYGMKITAEASSESIEIDAVNFQNADQSVFTAAITDINPSNYNRRYTATPFVKVKYDDGTEAKIYAADSITRSIYQVSVGLLKNSEADNGNDPDYAVETSYGLYDVLNAYVNMVGVRLSMDNEGNFTARTEGNGAYSGDIFFDVASEKMGEGVYKVTVTPVTENFNNAVTIMSYWTEFVRINNNNSIVKTKITDVVNNSDGGITFTFTTK